MDFYTVQEVAKILKVEPDTITKWVQSGRLIASHLSGNKTVRISSEHIQKFYNENVVKKERNTI